MSTSNRGGKGFSDAQPRSEKKANTVDHSANPSPLEVHAQALIHQGRLQEAKDIYEQLIKTGTKNHLVYTNLAAIHASLDQLNRFHALIRKALALKPNHPDAHNHLGLVLKRQGDLSSAISCFNKAIEIKPDYAEAHNNLGNALRQQAELDSAIDSFTTALALKPNYADAHNNLGLTLQEKGDLGAAIEAYHKALELKPNAAEAHYNLGNALARQGDLNAAIECFNTALQLNPLYPDAHNNLGIALQVKGELSAAIDAYQQAIQIKPNYPDAQVNLAITELLRGDYKNGWERYSTRFLSKGGISMLHAKPRCQQWTTELGQSNQEGKPQLLLVSEQGLGDTLQFMRYVIPLKERGFDVSLCAQPELHTLIQASGIVSAPLKPEQANHINTGHWIPLLSVPRILEVSPSQPIITAPYIRTTDERIAKWRDCLATEPRPIIAINWQGSAEHETTTLRGRSLPLETFAPIAQRTDASLLSLQKGYGSEQRADCSFRDRFVSCQQQIDATWDFLDTAAMIANCDLVITSDTCVAHLAGGMGKATWLVLKKVPEWGWGLDGDKSFWYPSMRLFRQTEWGNWDQVLRRVAEAVAATI